MSKRGENRELPAEGNTRLPRDFRGGTLEMYETHSGPLPAPQLLEQYDKILPGAAERILAMTEKHTDHFCKMERELLDVQKRAMVLDYKLKNKGQNYALTASLVMAGITLYSIILGHPGLAGAIGTTTIVGLVTVFVTGNSEKRSSEDTTAEIKENNEESRDGNTTQ